MNGVIRMTPTDCKQYSYRALAVGQSQPLLCIALYHISECIALLHSILLLTLVNPILFRFPQFSQTLFRNSRYICFNEIWIFNFTLYANLFFYAKKSADLILTQFLIFLSFILSTAKRPYGK